MKELFPVLLVLFLLLLISLAAAAGVVFWMSDPMQEPVGTVLTYEIDSPRQSGPTSVNMQGLIAALERRVNPGWSGIARIRSVAGGRIEISVFGDDPERVRRIERLVESLGTLEFRILANIRDHKALIEQARRENAPRVLNEAGDLLGWWVPVREDQQSKLQTYADIATRVRQEGDRQLMEILVAKDNFDVTGAYLQSVAPDLDDRGEPCLTFRLNTTGAKLFSGLTRNNLPDPIDMEFTRKLGIIVDEQLYSAPAIQEVISDRGQITGSFTRDEVRDLFNVLNAGSLPARIRQVSKRRIGAQR